MNFKYRYSEDKLLSERVKILNKVAVFMNTVMEPLRDRLAKDYSLKDDGGLYKKDLQDINAIIDSHADKIFKNRELQRARVEYSYGQFNLMVKVCVCAKDCGCEYLSFCGELFNNNHGKWEYKNSSLVYNPTPIQELKQWPKFTIKQVQARAKKIADAERKIEELKDKQRALRTDGGIYQYLHTQYHR